MQAMASDDFKITVETSCKTPLEKSFSVEESQFSANKRQKYSPQCND